jgi:hypothetical protein
VSEPPHAARVSVSAPAVTTAAIFDSVDLIASSMVDRARGTMNARQAAGWAARRSGFSDRD